MFTCFPANDSLMALFVCGLLICYFMKSPLDNFSLVLKLLGLRAWFIRDKSLDLYSPLVDAVAALVTLLRFLKISSVLFRSATKPLEKSSFICDFIQDQKISFLQIKKTKIVYKILGLLLCKLISIKIIQAARASSFKGFRKVFLVKSILIVHCVSGVMHFLFVNFF